MSKNLDQVLVKKFEAEAIQAFQEQSVGLRNAVRVRNAAGAQQVQFQVYGKVMANERTSVQTPIPVQDPSLAAATATVKRYTASIMTDIFLNNEVGFDARQPAVQGIVSALGRRLDQVVIDDALSNASGKTVAKDESGSNDNLNTSHVAGCARELGSAVPDTDRHLLCHDNGFYHFIQESDVKDIQISMYKALAEGRVPQYTQFNIHKMGDRSEGGLALSTNDRTNYAWHKESVGLALNMEPKVEINYDPAYGAHRITGFMSAGAVLIQDDGVVTLTTHES